MSECLARPSRCKGYAICLVIPLIALAACDRGGAPADTGSGDGVGASENAAIADNETAQAIDALFQPNALGPHEQGCNRAASTPSSSAAVAAPNMLTGAQIRHAILGHELTDGVHWAWTFRPAGRLSIDENGQSGRGRWRIERDRLCIDAGYGDACHTVSIERRSLRLWHDRVIAIEAELN